MAEVSSREPAVDPPPPPPSSSLQRRGVTFLFGEKFSPRGRAAPEMARVLAVLSRIRVPRPPRHKRPPTPKLVRGHELNGREIKKDLSSVRKLRLPLSTATYVMPATP